MGYVHVCGVPEKAEAAEAIARWPQGTITYFEDLVFEGLTREQVAAAYDRACDQWTAVCGLVFERVTDPSAANIIAHTGPIDGPYNVLAQSELPYGASATSVMAQLFDNSEPWAQEDIGMLVACICHEIGHAIGLEHLPGTGALLEPIIVPGRSTPQPPDIGEADARYGAATLPIPAKPVAGPAIADPFELLGHTYAPYLVGPFADGLVAAAKALEAGASTEDADLAALNRADALRNTCWSRIVEPKLSSLTPGARATAYRAIARGLAGSLAK